MTLSHLYKRRRWRSVSLIGDMTVKRRLDVRAHFTLMLLMAITLLLLTLILLLLLLLSNHPLLLLLSGVALGRGSVRIHAHLQGGRRIEWLLLLSVAAAVAAAVARIGLLLLRALIVCHAGRACRGARS